MLALMLCSYSTTNIIIFLLPYSHILTQNRFRLNRYRLISNKNSKRNTNLKKKSKKGGDITK
jgi:hypothetical protein